MAAQVVTATGLLVVLSFEREGGREDCHENHDRKDLVLGIPLLQRGKEEGWPRSSGVEQRLGSWSSSPFNLREGRMAMTTSGIQNQIPTKLAWRMGDDSTVLVGNPPYVCLYLEKGAKCPVILRRI